jgi:SAM-dependent methyltransferase
MLVRIAEMALVFAASLYVMRQARKPDRWLGRLMALGMNTSHGPLTKWGLEHVRIEPAFRMLDVGCGGGRTIARLAARSPQGHVDGIDFAGGSVATSRATNRAAIHDGRVEVQQASVSKLPFPDASFDLVTAVETHYYWPDPPNDLREIVRTLKPGGTLLVIAESYRGGRGSAATGPIMKLLSGGFAPGVAEMGTWFEGAGLAEVTVDEQRSHGWICATGRRPL